MRRWLRASLIRVLGLFNGKRHDGELDAELESHLELHTDDGVRSGLSREAARRQAMLKLGSLDATKEQYRDRRTVPAIDSLIRDLRYAVRVLRKQPGFSVAAVIVLALGIGANTAIFSVVHAVLLRPLPYPDPGRLVFVWHVPPPAGFPGMTRFAVSPANFRDWRAQSRTFAHMAIVRFRSFTLTGGPEPEMIRARGVSADFFDVMGVHPILGRAFLADEDRPGTTKVVVLSERLWTRRFGADPSLVGRTIPLDGEPYVVVGIMGEAFRFPESAELWTPNAWTEKEWAVRDNHNCTVVARLNAGADLEGAQAEMTAISRRLEQEYPKDNKGWGAVVVPFREVLVEDIRPSLLVLLGAVAFVLLIACANVTNLVLARTVARRKEIGLRMALGASGGRVMRQILSETALLGLAGGAAGLIVARGAIALILAFLGETLPDASEIVLDLPVLLFTVAASLAAGIASGLGAAWRLTRTNVNEALKQGLSRTDADVSGQGTRAALVVSEVALSLMLLIGAGLMIRSLWHLRNVDPGLDPHGVLTASLVLPKAKYGADEQQIRFYTQLVERLRVLPGVGSVGLTSTIPLSGDSSHWPIAIEGKPAPVAAEQPEVQAVMASPGFLNTLRIPVVRGRDLADTDVVGRPFVALVSESMARHFWPGDDPLGKRFTTVFLPEATLEVVGVVKDVKLQALDVSEPIEAMYLPFAQQPNAFMSVVVRTSAPPSGLVSALTHAVHEIDRDQPVVDIMTMDEVLAASIAQRRFTMLLLVAFAGLALALAAVGIYSVLAYSVRQRVREIGIRLALGAEPLAVLRLIVMNGLKPTVIGLVIGVIAAAALTRLLGGFFYGVSGTDPLTFAGVSVMVLVVSLGASLIPAYRATRVDPMRTLREE
jgi:predicted permease